MNCATQYATRACLLLVLALAASKLWAQGPPYQPGQQFLFCYGHSIAGQTENYAYAGMYWTWGKDDKDKKDTARNNWMQRLGSGNGLE